MSAITLYTRSLLEAATMAVTGEDAGFPATRLHDRSIALFWRYTATGAVAFKLDQGSTGSLAVDFLAVARHNFGGQALAWQYSSDNFVADIHDAVPGWIQPDNLPIVRTLPAPITARYWRVIVGSMSNPQCSEIFMGAGLTLEIMSRPNPSGRFVSNVQWTQTVGGQERSTKLGDRRLRRSFPLFVSPAGLDGLRDALDALDEYSRPFYLKDDAGAVWPCRLEDDPLENFDHKTHTHLTLNVIEML